MKLIRNILLIATGLSMASCNYLDVNTEGQNVTGRSLYR